MAPSTSGLSHHPFTVESRVRIPPGSFFDSLCSKTSRCRDPQIGANPIQRVLRYTQQFFLLIKNSVNFRSGFESQYALGGIWCNGSKKEKYLVNFPILFHIAGWSSLEARWAHNPEVGGSNPSPATRVMSTRIHFLSGDLGMSSFLH